MTSKTLFSIGAALILTTGRIGWAATATNALTAGQSGYWTNNASWNTTPYPGSAANESAYLTANLAGAFTNVLDASLGNALNNLVISNGNAGGAAWLIVTNTVLTTSNLIVGVGGRLRLDKGGVLAGGVTAGNRASNTTLAVVNSSTLDLTGGTLAWGAGVASNNALTVDGSSTITNVGNFALSDAGRTVTLANGMLNGMNIQFSGGGLTIGTGPNTTPVGLVMSNYTLNPFGSGVGGTSTIGYGSSPGNAMTVLPNAVWNNGNQSLILGSVLSSPNGIYSSNNLLKIDGQGVCGYRCHRG